MALLKAKCDRCQGRKDLIQVPNRRGAWAICGRCLSVARDAAGAGDEQPDEQAA